MYARCGLLPAMLLPAMLLPATAAAQTVHECTVGGHNVYQSLPCAAEHDTGRQRRGCVTRCSARRNAMLPGCACGRHASASSQPPAAGRGSAPRRGSVIEDLADAEACESERWRKELCDAFGKARSQADTQRRQAACRRT